jgi:hypothetical protein
MNNCQHNSRKTARCAGHKRKSTWQTEKYALEVPRRAFLFAALMAANTRIHCHYTRKYIYIEKNTILLLNRSTITINT